MLDNAQSLKGWLMFYLDYAGRGYAPFTKIDAKNVSSLKEVWSSPKVHIPNG